MVQTKSLNTISQRSPGNKARTKRRKEYIRGYDRTIRRAKRERSTEWKKNSKELFDTVLKPQNPKVNKPVRSLWRRKLILRHVDYASNSEAHEIFHWIKKYQRLRNTSGQRINPSELKRPQHEKTTAYKRRGGWLNSPSLHHHRPQSLTGSTSGAESPPSTTSGWVQGISFNTCI